MIFSAIVDLDALWKILVVALAVGVGMTSVFGAGAVAYERYTEEHRPADAAVAGVAALACLAALVVGFLAITHK
jgi:hypothetical protein